MKKVSTLFLGVCLFFSIVHLEAQALWDARSYLEDAYSRMDTEFAHQEATPLDTYYLGRAVAANILAAYRPYTGSPALTRYLNLICQTIVINSAFPDLFNGYHVIILDSPEFNAFATPSGHIFITRGLVGLTTSEDMLAALIAHELAHIMLKHGLSIIDDVRLLVEMPAMADRAVQFADNPKAAARYTYFRNSVDAMFGALVRNGFSRDQESDADEGAVVLLAASGYSPAGFLDLLRVLQQVQASQRGGFNATHPSPTQRLVRVQSYVRQYQVRDTQSYRESRFMNK